MKRLIFLLAAGIGSLAVAGAAPSSPPPEPAVYHVDDAAGADDRDGRTPESAWRSLEQVNAAALRPGDSVLFRRGGVWRGQLVPRNGDTGRVITYGAYGRGPKPLLLGSTAANRPADWQPAGDGLWTTVGPRYEPAGEAFDLRKERWGFHQESGAVCRCEPPASATDAEAAYRVVCENPGTRENHIQFGTSVPSIAAGGCYEFAFRARSSAPFAPARLTLLKNGPPYTTYAAPVGAGAPPVIGTNWTEHTFMFRATQATDDVRLAIFLGGALPAGATLQIQPRSFRPVRSLPCVELPRDVGNIIFDDGAATGVKKWKPEELREEGDFLYDAARAQVTLRCATNPAARFRSIELALTRHIIDEGGRRHVAYEGLALKYGAAHGIGGGGVRDITVRGCDLAFIGGGLQHTRPDGRPVRYGNGVEFWGDARQCLVEDCRLWEIYDAALTNQGSETNVQENITYRRNTIWNSEYSFEYWNRGEASRTHNIRFEYNTCVDAGFGWGHRQRPDPNGRHVMFYANAAQTRGVTVRHNIFSRATDSLLRLHGRDWTAALSMDDNVWHQPEGPVLLWGEETIGADRFAAFMTPRGFDAHSITADPGFAAPAERDYRLRRDAPARRVPAGADATPPADRPGRVRIGAYFFDGWSGRNRLDGDPAQPWAKGAPTHLSKSLAEEYGDREPVWGWRCDTPELMTRQIDLAADHGLAFWAFCWYFQPEAKDVAADPKHTGMNLFMAATNNNRLQFCLLVANHDSYQLRTIENWRKAADYWLPVLKHPRHLTMNGKPLIILFNPSDALPEGLALVDEAARKAGLPGVAFAGCGVHLPAGFEASTRYNAAGGWMEGWKALPFSTVLDRHHASWAAEVMQPHIPCSIVGWDRRPWESPEKGSVYFTGRTPEQFGRHIRDLIGWMDAHPESVTKERLALIYAWNELGEGGYLVPTKGDPDGAYLKALRAAVRDVDRRPGFWNGMLRLGTPGRENQ